MLGEALGNGAYGEQTMNRYITWVANLPMEETETLIAAPSSFEARKQRAASLKLGVTDICAMRVWDDERNHADQTPDDTPSIDWQGFNKPREY